MLTKFIFVVLSICHVNPLPCLDLSREMKRGECPLLSLHKLELNPLLCLWIVLHRASEAWFTDAGGAESLGANLGSDAQSFGFDLEQGG